MARLAKTIIGPAWWGRTRDGLIAFICNMATKIHGFSLDDNPHFVTGLEKMRMSQLRAHLMREVDLARSLGWTVICPPAGRKPKEGNDFFAGVSFA